MLAGRRGPYLSGRGPRHRGIASMWCTALSRPIDSLQRLILNSKYALRTWKPSRLPWVVPLSIDNVSAPTGTLATECRIVLVNLVHLELTSGCSHPTR